MTESQTLVRRERFPLVFRQLEVKRVEPVTPRYVRVTLGGDELAGFASLAPDDHLKVLFPVNGAAKPVLPTATEAGWSFPDGQPRPPSRDFTPRHYDPQAGELELEFVLHGSGPASTWAANAAPGQYVGVAGPRGSYIVSPVHDWYLLTGDETAIAAMSRWLEIIPASAKVTALIEVNDEDDIIDLPTYAELDARWLYRNGAAPGSTSLLLDAITSLEFPDSRNYYWAAGEAGAMKAIRRHLLGERGVAKDDLHISGHWKYQVTNWDHHEPIDDEA